MMNECVVTTAPWATKNAKHTQMMGTDEMNASIKTALQTSRCIRSKKEGYYIVLYICTFVTTLGKNCGRNDLIR